MFVLNTIMAYITAADRKEDKGATAVEYALVVGLVSLIVVAAVALFGPAITAFVGNIDFGA
ncbi:MAG: Flp family type IVb pilin [Aeromicrobium sp.]